MRGVFTAAFAAAAIAVVPSAAAATVTDGQWVLIDDQPAGGQLVTMNAVQNLDLPRGERTIHTARAGVKLDAPQFSPDGNKIVFVEGTRILLYDVASTQVTEVAPNGYAPSWAPDSNRVSFLRDGVLLTRALDGSGEQVLPIDASGARDAAWSPDGDWFALWVGESIDVVGVDGTGRESVADRAHGGVAWAPNSASFAFPRMSLDINRVELYRMTQTGGSLVQGAFGTDPEFSPTGRAIVYTDADGGITQREGGSALVGGMRNTMVPSQLDWQPCVEGVTTSCVSTTPPLAPRKLDCHVIPGQVIPAFTNRAVRVTSSCPNSIGFEIVEAAVHGTATPDHNAVSYLSAPGYVGQDTFVYRARGLGGRSSEPIRVTLNVSAPPLRPAAPKLTLGAGTLKLDRRGRVTVNGACDRACIVSLQVRVKLRSGRVVSGRTVKARAGTGGVVKLRLQRGELPAGRKVAWVRVSGRVVGADGRSRSILIKLR